MSTSTSTSKTKPRRRQPVDKEAEAVAVADPIPVDAGSDVGDAATDMGFDSAMKGFSGSLKEKVSEVLSSQPEESLVTAGDDPTLIGPVGNHDFIKPGSLKHLFFLGFDEFGNYLSDLNHLPEKEQEVFIATRLRWWYVARSEEGVITFPAGCPEPFSPDGDVEEITAS